MLEALRTKIVYPKLILLGACIVLAYVLFQTEGFQVLAEQLNHGGYVSIFLAGCLFAYGFTAPFAVGFFFTLSDDVNLFLAAPLAALGALFSDLLIFSWIHTSFKDEFERIKLTRVMRRVRQLFNHHLDLRLRKYFMWVVAGFIIGSPLPDEIGVSLVSGFTALDKRMFCLIDYSCNLVGIGTLLWLSA